MTHESPPASSRPRRHGAVAIPSLERRRRVALAPIFAALALVLVAGCAAESSPAASTEAVIPADYVGAAGATPTSACYAAMNEGGLGAACASCLCGRCEAPAEGCGGDARCVAAATCALENDCSGRDCFCGGSLLCGVLPSGPCKDQYRAAAGVSSWSRIQAVLASSDQNNALVRAENLVRCSGGVDCGTQCGDEAADTCFFMNDEACQDRYCSVDTAREAARAASAASVTTPVIKRVRINGTSRWTTGSTTPVAVAPGDRVVLEGTGFGAGPDVDFAKIAYLATT